MSDIHIEWIFWGGRHATLSYPAIREEWGIDQKRGGLDSTYSSHQKKRLNKGLMVKGKQFQLIGIETKLFNKQNC